MTPAGRTADNNAFRRGLSRESSQQFVNVAPVAPQRGLKHQAPQQIFIPLQTNAVAGPPRQILATGPPATSVRVPLPTAPLVAPARVVVLPQQPVIVTTNGTARPAVPVVLTTSATTPATATTRRPLNDDSAAMADEEDGDDEEWDGEDGRQLDSDEVRDQRDSGEDEETKRAAAGEVAVELSKLFGDSTRRRQVTGDFRI